MGKQVLRQKKWNKQLCAKGEEGKECLEKELTKLELKE
jgi:hypothetical protein